MSHRAREKMQRELGRHPEAYYSFYQASTGGFFEITDKEYKKLAISGIKGISKLRDTSNIHKCQSW